MAKKAKKGKVVAIPKSREEASQQLSRMGELDLEIEKIEGETATQVAVHEAAIKKLVEAATNQITPLTEQQDDLFKGLQTWADSNRDTLLPNEERTKTIELPSGRISYALTPPSVKMSSGSKVEDVVAELTRRQLSDYIRTKKEPDKEKLIADREALAKRKPFTTFSINQREEIIMKPNRSRLELRIQEGGRKIARVKPD